MSAYIRDGKTRITSYNVCYTKLLRSSDARRVRGRRCGPIAPQRFEQVMDIRQTAEGRRKQVQQGHVGQQGAAHAQDRMLANLKELEQAGARPARVDWVSGAIVV